MHLVVAGGDVDLFSYWSRPFRCFPNHSANFYSTEGAKEQSCILPLGQSTRADKSTDQCAADHHDGRALRKVYERTTAGRGCLLGRGPAVRIADPEEADPLNPQRGNAPGSAIVACSAKTFTNWAALAQVHRASCRRADRASFAAYF